MASVQRLFLLTATLSLFSAALSNAHTPPQALLDAAETLANSGYIAMSLTVQLIAPTLPLPSATTTSTTTTVTIFSPPDAAFKTFGQPSLANLLLHFSPLSLSPTFLLSLPLSSKIPTLSTSHYLTITTPPDSKKFEISINNVTVSVSPIFDDGSVLVYAIDNFFGLNFSLPPNTTKTGEINPNRDLKCLKLEKYSRFQEASGVLKSRGYSIMASFLDLQLMGFAGEFSENVKLTVFAPVDEELVQFSGDFMLYSSLFMRHVVPCKVGWNELNQMGNGTVLPNNAEGFNLEITRNEDGEVLMVNGIEIMFPGMHDSEWLAIHGIRGLITEPETTEEETEMEEYYVTKIEESIAPDRGEF
ncbi:putative fasciclin-like arabinogalactan protein 20 [Forsythia ovata]|uniref:Fasciclin-like arabinogalactan protein 20 n=1 Tax=Forsythia ovata TaxID=205694 RepID=A0ABD1W8P7_9LAMI